ncbi:PepSY-associated TM helix domain-containing protein [Lutimonas sp.]|uniref:PepSY-associated TM helix domain-containing protein n=1 Tax=Lutimonas sp. TaxID=1872403 RepID=UPI003D9B6424
MKFTNRSIHRDVAFFYVGLLIAFSFSGIILNHRQDWYPMDYTYESKEVELKLPADLNNLDDKYLSEATTHWNVEEKFDSHRLRGESLRVYFKDNIVADIDAKTGKGLLEYKRKTPFIGHTMYLHKTTNNFWIWYSDIFGAAMILIAVTGILIPAGKNGFKKRGWKLALAGLLFPLVFLFFLA